MWFFGYEFPSTLMVLTPDALHVLATKKKAQHLQKLKGGKVPIEILIKTKDVAETEAHFKTLLDAIKAGGVCDSCKISYFQQVYSNRSFLMLLGPLVLLQARRDEVLAHGSF